MYGSVLDEKGIDFEMNLKQQAAKSALEYIRSGIILGLGQAQPHATSSTYWGNSGRKHTIEPTLSHKRPRFGYFWGKYIL